MVLNVYITIPNWLIFSIQQKSGGFFFLSFLESSGKESERQMKSYEPQLETKKQGQPCKPPATFELLLSSFCWINTGKKNSLLFQCKPSWKDIAWKMMDVYRGQSFKELFYFLLWFHFVNSWKSHKKKAFLIWYSNFDVFMHTKNLSKNMCDKVTSVPFIAQNKSQGSWIIKPNLARGQNGQLSWSCYQKESN